MAEKQQHVHQDVVEYSLFPILDRFLDEDETVQVLEEYLNTYLAHLSNDLVGYIWQDEPFRLKIVCNENLSGRAKNNKLSNVDTCGFNSHW